MEPTEASTTSQLVRSKILEVYRQRGNRAKTPAQKQAIMDEKAKWLAENPLTKTVKLEKSYNRTGSFFLFVCCLFFNSQHLTFLFL